MATAAAARVFFEPHIEATFDPFEENMGEGSQQRFLSEDLRPEVDRLFRERGEEMFVGADQYIGWHPHDPKKVVSPDVYVLLGVPPRTDFDFWKVWQTGIVPTFALEIVSSRKGKDYVDAPARYAELGVKELIVFDPRYKRRRGGVLWQVFRPIARRGFVRVEVTNDDRVRSRVLDCWLRAVSAGKQIGIRLAANPRGDELIPTAAEVERVRTEAERARADVERARADAERAKTEAERARAEHAEAEVERTRAEIAELRRKLATRTSKG